MKAIPTIILAAALLSGCVAAAVNTSTLAVKAGPREELLPLADAGDSAAQYELGKSYCCMGVGFSTQMATEWLCKSARQGNADAMYELGRIYRGDVSRTLAPGQKLLRAMTAKESRPHAFLWLSLAATTDHPEAEELLTELKKKISKSDRDAATRLSASWRDVPCEYERVFAER